MGGNHHHHHHHNATKNIKVAFFINLGFAALEVVGGFFTNSIAIISDALHDFGDSLSLGLAWYLEHKAEKKGATQEFSFGYARFRLLGALINAVVLVLGSVYIIYEAIHRLQDPQPIKSGYMIGIAVIGVLSNSYAAWRVQGGKSLNEKVISWHLIEDVMGWVAVLVVAIILQFRDWYFLDPALSIGITLYILWGVGRRLIQTLHLLLQGVPEGISLEEVKGKLLKVPHVNSIHHTHIWSLDGQHHVLSSHLVLEDIVRFQQIDEVRQQAVQALEAWEFSHHTLQLELDKESCPLVNT